MAKYAMSKYFGNGAGHVMRFHNSETLLFYWNGKADGAARAIPHLRRFARNGVEYASLAALLRAVEESHKLVVPRELEESTASLWLASGTLAVESFGSENTYYIDRYGNKFYCKNYPRHSP